MATVSFDNHSSAMVPKSVRKDLLKFYVDILDGVLMPADPERDFISIGGNFFIAFLYGDVPDASDFLRSAPSIWLKLKSDDVCETREKITESGLVRILDIPDPHLYFQAPGGQCLRLVGSDEDLSFYEGTGTGPDMEKINAALKQI